MQPVNDSRLLNQVDSARQRVPGNRETSSHPVKRFAGRDALNLPGDIVNISASRFLTADSGVNKKPSVPVTPVERKALKESFSVYV